MGSDATQEIHLQPHVPRDPGEKLPGVGRYTQTALVWRHLLLPKLLEFSWGEGDVKAVQ